MSNSPALSSLPSLAYDLRACYEEIHQRANIGPECTTAWLRLRSFLNAGRQIIEQHKATADEDSEVGRTFAAVALVWPDMDAKAADENEHRLRFVRLADAASRLEAALITSKVPRATPAEDEERIPQTTKPKASKPKVTVEEAAAKLEEIRSQGQKFTSQANLASQLKCGVATVNKAIKGSYALTAWASGRQGAPRAQSLNGLVTDNSRQSREPDPVEEAAAREFLEKADDENRTWFLALSPNDQREYLNDPDRHRKVLGRKP